MSSPEYHPRLERGDESYPSREEIAYFQRILRHPEILPEQFWRTVIAKVSLDIDKIPSSQIQGGARVGVWKDYTPTWSSTGTAPAIGNGTIAGAYSRQGDSILAFVTITMGTTTTYGTGNWTISLPAESAGQDRYLGGATYADDSAAATYAGFAISPGGTTLAQPVTNASPVAGITSTSPFIWAASDILHISIGFRAATS